MFRDKPTVHKVNWQRLDKSSAHHVLDHIAREVDKGLFPEISTEVKCQSLDFCKNFMLYRLTNYAAMPSFRMDFLSDGENFYYLSGSAEPIYNVNKRAPIALREDNILNYLDFFFTNVQSEDGDIYIVRDPASLPFMSSLPQEQQIELNAHHLKPSIEFDAMTDAYIIKTTLYYAGGLMTSVISVSTSGEIDFLDLKLLLSDMTHYFEVQSAEDYYVRA